MIIDDEPAIARALEPALKGHDFTVATAVTGMEALEKLEQFLPDVILLDLALPDIDGVALAADLRKQTAAPIIVLSVRGADRDKIAALDNGADDYLTKPFSIGELMARIRVALRRTNQAPQAAPAGPISVNSITLDPDRHTVTVDNAPVHLSPTEFQLLHILMQHAGKPVTHRTLLYKAWGPEYAGDTQLLRVYIGQLRGKIEPRPDRPTHILTEPGIGYRFQES